ncbi:hypothetical protein NECAME_13012 [Necator americanus]|uniref:Uncharacterized protein n=1 Tax=Necator americanus TaxID=51031 RepID=W2SZK1_NECAM|nr:hypothetical protein NECAME_13012 [Necator americanus]ETN74416.1 hypothetical protein NECAME_13012 [Necator americanus]
MPEQPDKSAENGENFNFVAINHPKMSQQYALFLFVFAVSLSGSLQQANCPEDKYGLNSTMREELYKGLKPMMKSGQLVASSSHFGDEGIRR